MSRAEGSDVSDTESTPEVDAVTVQDTVPQWLLDALASTSADDEITVTLTRGKWGGVLGAIDEVICRLEEREAGRETSGLRKSLEASYSAIHDALTAGAGFGTAKGER